MSDEVVMFFAISLSAMLAGFFLVGLTMWAIAEWDERKWRKRMGEIAAEGFDRG
jgi:hypothetical protein